MLRTTGFGGKVVLSPGVANLATRDDVVRAVMAQDPNNGPKHDPTGRNEFGVVNLNNVRYFWKIDYYDRSYTVMSPDPADPLITKRVLTILRADEW